MAATHKERVAERAARRRLRKAGEMREPTFEEVDEMRATAPEMSELVIGKRQWWAALCGCTFHRKGGEQTLTPHFGARVLVQCARAFGGFIYYHLLYKCAFASCARVFCLCARVYHSKTLGGVRACLPCGAIPTNSVTIIERFD